MNRRGFTILQAVLLLVVVGILAAVFIPVVMRGFGGKENPPLSTCQYYLKQIGLGLMQYQQDYDEKFPLVSSGREGWVDIAQPYLKSRGVFHCPEFGMNSDATTSDYFFNARLSGLPASEVRSFKPAVTPTNDYFTSVTIMGGDGLVGAGNNAHITELPFEWINDENSPARRHLDGANYLFTDGHVKWYKPARIGTASPRKGVDEPTFAIR